MYHIISLTNYRKSLMHCYEVIPEAAVCHLYFDLEFMKQTNPELDGKEMVSKLIQYVCQKLGELYNIHCSVKDVLNLDSSTHEKFSRHLVFHFLNAAFKSNIDVGNFIRKIMQPVIEELTKRRGTIGQETQRTSEEALLSTSTPYVPLSPDKRKHFIISGNLSSKKIKCPLWEKSEERILEPDLSFLVVKDKHGTDQLFVDLGVYTRNRNFRLYGSSKLGKNTSFQVAEDNQFVPNPQDNVSKEELYFLSSLVSNVRFFDGLTILTCDSPDMKKSKECHTQDNLYHPVSEAMGGYRCSPYPEIDNFIIGKVNKGGIQGVLHRWNYFCSEELIVYDIGKNRWCENIGRAHKSNNIMIVVDLKREVWYQKCYDPMCRAQRFRSESHPLPHECCLDFLIDLENEFVFTMDGDGNIKASQNTPYSTPTPILVDTGFDNIDDVMLLEAAADTEISEELQLEPSGVELSDTDLLAAAEELEASVSGEGCTMPEI
ncbi:DNA-directed primase/polymerase protein isoform X2 [Narcine bancroftii]|uniref:DNA-directed primase/polymerase protein isoform X2 n=1 Tax=Narcine bancroftii TaxID=1343680 RepID=UPI0038316C11